MRPSIGEGVLSSSHPPAGLIPASSGPPLAGGGTGHGGRNILSVVWELDVTRHALHDEPRGVR